MRKQWYVMRDLTRPNAKLPAYKLLMAEGMEVFTPMIWRLSVRRGKQVREKVPFMHDLLFVHEAKSSIDSILSRVPTLQFRYRRGAYCDPMIVKNDEMKRFIQAVESVESPRYYSLDEVTSSMLGRMVRIEGGQLDGYEGHLLSVRGSRVKRLLIELPGLLAVGVEVSPEFIQLL